MTTEALERAVLASIWSRIQWDFLLNNPQLDEWLVGSTLEVTDDPDVYRVVVQRPDVAQWLSVHVFTIRRALSVEMKRPVVVRVVAREAVKG